MAINQLIGERTCGPALEWLSNTTGLYSKTDLHFKSLSLPPPGHVTFAKSVKLSELDWQIGFFHSMNIC